MKWLYFHLWQDRRRNVEAATQEEFDQRKQFISASGMGYLILMETDRMLVYKLGHVGQGTHFYVREDLLENPEELLVDVIPF